jgi:hypothetical protein
MKVNVALEKVISHSRECIAQTECFIGQNQMFIAQTEILTAQACLTSKLTR